MEKRIQDTLRQLVAVRSDSGTVSERDMAAKLYEILREDPYFQEHPELCGLYDGGDPLGRPVVWGLKLAPCRRTVILSGHYDAVETSPYGVFEPYALQPDLLKEKMLESGRFSGEVLEHLQDENWMFGRGAADMKAGDAINLHLLREFEPKDKCLLITAVSDEENLSAGARQAIGLYQMLQEKYGLEYVYAAVTESCALRGGGEGDPLLLLNGTSGKLLPVAVVKGRLAHSAYVMNGLNSALILAEIIRSMEINTDFLSFDQGMCNQPPATQIFSDLKPSYDVSTPEYSAVGFNMTYYAADDPMERLERLKQVCYDACRRAVEKYEDVFDRMTAAGQLFTGYRAEYSPTVLSLVELKERLRGVPDFAKKDRELQNKMAEEIRSGKATMQKAGIRYIHHLMELGDLPAPTVVVGVVPPFYPTVSAAYLSRDIRPMVERAKKALEEKGYTFREHAYTQGMTDMSYMACLSPRTCAAVMENMAVPGTIYAIDFAALAHLNVPTQLIGPASRNIHQMLERVYLPDVDEHIPCLLRELIRQA